MICRLCLVKLGIEKCVLLFNTVQSEVDYDVVKIIARYLRLQIKQDDTVSNAICQKCFKQLNEFHKFCAFVEKKQETLRNQLANRTEEESSSNEDSESVSSFCTSPALDPLEIQLKSEPEVANMTLETLNMPSTDEHSVHECNAEDFGFENVSHQSSIKFFSNEQNILKRNSVDLVTKNKTIKKRLIDMEQTLLNQSAAFTKHSKNLQKSVDHQNALIRKQSELLEVLLEKFPLKTNFDIFPFKHISQMEEFEKSINNYDEVDLIHYIKNLIGKTSISKCIHLIFDSDCLLEVNWDGKYNKIPVKSTYLFSKLVFEAVKSEDYGFSQFANDVKKGFRTAKNKQYRHKFSQKKSDFNFAS